MPDPLAAAILSGYAALQVLARPGSALSAEARALRSTAVAVIESARRSEALFGAREAAISRLWALVEECAEPSWDGDGARPLSERAAALAADLIRTLPDDVPMPELSAEPDGSIGLDWIQSRHRLLSISVGSRSRLAYAWLDGTDRGHGVAWFDGEMTPPRILAGIRGVMSRGDAAVGPS